MITLQERLRGIAVGAAVGDALGMPLEFHPARAPENLQTEMVDGPLPAGSFTDDTEMALCLAESLLTTSPLDIQDLAGRFVTWYWSRPPDIGMHTSRVLAQIAAGVSPLDAAAQVQAEEPESAGNGSLMRNWPVAIARLNNPGLLASESRLQSEVTHPHADSVNACLLMNEIIYEILHSSNPSTDALIRQAVTYAVGKVPLDPDFAVTIQLAAMRLPRDLKNTGWVRHSIETTLWALQTTHSFEEAVVQAANLGNDADTSASITGAVAGALYGLQGIPQRWRQRLHGEFPLHTGKLWFEADFIHLADRLAQVGTS